MDADKTIQYALIAGAIVLVLWLIAKAEKILQPAPLTQEQFENAVIAAGGEVKVGQKLVNGDGTQRTYMSIPGGVAYLPPSANLNLAQRVLIGLDRWVPGTWLTRTTLGV